jgi:hypothetical protein
MLGDAMDARTSGRTVDLPRLSWSDDSVGAAFDDGLELEIIIGAGQIFTANSVECFVPWDLTKK